jgi:hypothetical protein
MPRLRRAHLPAWLVVASAAWCAACSSNNALEARDDPFRDASAIDLVRDNGDAGDATISVAGQSVWFQDSTGFELTRMGGPSLPPCGALDETWRYDATSHVATVTGCSVIDVSEDASIGLPSACASDLAVFLSSLKTTSPGSDCGEDGEQDVLTIFGPGGAQRRYLSDWNAGCPFPFSGSDASSGPFLAAGDLQVIVADLFGGGISPACDFTEGPDAAGGDGATIGDAGVDGDAREPSSGD